MTNTVDLSEVVFYDPIPMHVVTAWLSVFLPIAIAIRCAFIRDRGSASAVGTARRALAAISIQFGFFAFCVTTRFVDVWMEQTIMAGTWGSRAMLPDIYLQMLSYLMWELTIQTAVTLAGGWFVVRWLHYSPKLWNPWFSVIVAGLLAGSHLAIMYFKRIL